MLKLPTTFILCLCSFSILLQAQSTLILSDRSNDQAQYAVKKLSATLIQEGYSISENHTDYDYLINLSIHSNRLGAESFTIIPEGRVITVLGGDSRGLIYGALALAEEIRNGIPIDSIKVIREEPNQEFRGIKYNLPWETYRPSLALDQHLETAKDLNYWEAFLDMMVENRFNAISLWNMHPYTFMIQPKNFPEASPWTQQEFDAWQHLYREIFRMAKERGLDTYIVHWSIFVSKELAEAHNVAHRNFYPYYYVEGDTTELVARYIRESVRQVLEEYPNLDGIGISHGEGMAGMTPLERQQWMDDVIIAGMLEVDRPVKLIHRVPFSSGTSSDPGVSKNVEEVTRSAMEKLGDAFEGPIWVEMKFNWSHAHSTPELVKVHGGKLGDTYFDPAPTNYKVTWQARNEDFFALRWGVPSFIRQHIALNGKADYVGGYFVGSETYIPALDYFTNSEADLSWKWAFERQWLFYKLWGRLLYNPETSNQIFVNEYVHRYGEPGRNLLNAMSLASSTQLRLASLYDSRWDFTLYSEGFLALQGDTTKYIGIDQLINQPSMAKNYVSIKDYMETLDAGGSFPADVIIPPILAEMLERDCAEALRIIEDIDAQEDVALMYELADIRIWSNLGLHLAAKIRGGMALKKYQDQGVPADQASAVRQLELALNFWDEVIKISRPIYKDMRLTHYNHNFFYANDDNFFHWALLRDEVVRDIEVAKEGR